MDLFEKYQLDKTQFKASTTEEVWNDESDLAFWLSQTDQQRLEGIELLRQINYGQHYADEGLQRILTITQREER